MQQRQRGFTLIEVLLSVAIIGMLVGLSLPLFQSFQSRNDLELTTQSVAGALRRAQTYARGVNGDSTWSVRIQSGSAVLYKGSTYASRDTSFDETTAIPSNFAVSGLSDVTFSKLVAVPSATGIVSITGTTNDTRTVTINAEGMVTY